MDKHAKIYIAGHRGLVVSAIARDLLRKGYTNLLPWTRAGMALLRQVRRQRFLGTTCCYPKPTPQPLRKKQLLTGLLDPTNRHYALPKIAGIAMSWCYNRQHGTKYLAAMPTNLYGPGDNYHPENSRVILALIRKFHEAKVRGDKTVTVWGTGTPRRGFLYSDDMADACVYLMNLPADKYLGLLGSDESKAGRFEPPLINIGVGEDVTIRELAETVQRVVGFQGALVVDGSRPDGTLRKLMDVSWLRTNGWVATTSLLAGLGVAYDEFFGRQHAV